jgi:hypothetical protein
VANLVNANNNAQNWNGDFTFVGTNNLNLGSGAVTTANAYSTVTVTVSAGTLTTNGDFTLGNPLTKAGGGTLSLAGALPLGTTSSLIVSNGTLKFSGVLTTGTGTATVECSFKRVEVSRTQCPTRTR